MILFLYQLHVFSQMKDTGDVCYLTESVMQKFANVYLFCLLLSICVKIRKLFLDKQAFQGHCVPSDIFCLFLLFLYENLELTNPKPHTLHPKTYTLNFKAIGNPQEIYKKSIAFLQRNQQEILRKPIKTYNNSIGILKATHRKSIGNSHEIHRTSEGDPQKKKSIEADDM